jgi:hypothetical protein
VTCSAAIFIPVLFIAAATCAVVIRARLDAATAGDAIAAKRVKTEISRLLIIAQPIY